MFGQPHTWVTTDDGKFVAGVTSLDADEHGNLLATVEVWTQTATEVVTVPASRLVGHTE